MIHEETHMGQACDEYGSSDCRECEAYDRSAQCLREAVAQCANVKSSHRNLCERTIGRALKVHETKRESFCSKCPEDIRKRFEDRE